MNTDKTDAGAEEKKKTAVPKKTPAQREREEKEKILRMLSQKRQSVTAEHEKLVQEEKSLDLPDVTGFCFHHRKFGDGEVVSAAGRVFTIRFNEKQIKMQFPDAFDRSILTVESEEQQKIVESICTKVRSHLKRESAAKNRMNELSTEMSNISI